MKLYCGIDLHSNNGMYALVDDQGNRRGHRRLPNDLDSVLGYLEPHREALAAIAVESTYNWYWLVDGLMEADYTVQLANPNAIDQYDGIKHAGDKHDAYFLAELQRLSILPTGYIYPKDTRSLRDLVRRRMLIKRYHTGLKLSLQGLFTRATGDSYSWRRTAKLSDDDLTQLLAGDEVLIFTAQQQRQLIQEIDSTLNDLERHALNLCQERPEHELLTTIPGVGKLLAMIIMLETGTIDRFPKVGNYTSYCRFAKALRTSNGKTKDRNNRKNGNRYLSWAWTEAAFHMRQWSSLAQAWYQRKAAKSLPIVAERALGAKCCKAGYYMLTRHEPFHEERVF